MAAVRSRPWRSRIVEELALDPPRVVIHLLPFDARLGPHLDVLGPEREGPGSATAAGPAGAGGPAAAAPPAPPLAGGIGRSDLDRPAIGLGASGSSRRSRRLRKTARPIATTSDRRCCRSWRCTVDAGGAAGCRRRSLDREQVPGFADLQGHVAACRAAASARMRWLILSQSIRTSGTVGRSCRLGRDSSPAASGFASGFSAGFAVLSSPGFVDPSPRRSRARTATDRSSRAPRRRRCASAAGWRCGCQARATDRNRCSP